MADSVELGLADFSEQGKLGELLIEVYGPVWKDEYEKALSAGFEPAPYEDELMAADDFWFSNVELMNCCIFARSGKRIVGAACINPYTSTLQFLAVKESWRRKGVGRELLKGAEDVLRRVGAKHIKIDFSLAEKFTAAREFFACCGYLQTRSQVTYGRKL